MTYITVKNPEDYKALLTRYLAKKDRLKQQLESDRTGQYDFYTEASKLFKPITTAVGTVGDTQLAKLQSLQDTTTHNQNNLLKALTNQTDVLNTLGGNPFGAYPMISDSPPAAQVEPQTQSKIVDFNKDLNLDHLKEYGLVPPNDLVNADISDITKMINKTKSLNSKFGAEKRSTNKRPIDIINVDIEDTKKYRDRLRQLQASRGLVTAGNGLKITTTGSLGRLQIDPKLLRTGRLKAYLGGQLVMDTPADSSLCDLLTKQFVASKEYTPEAVEIFRDLVRLSELQTTGRRRNRKVELLKNTQSDIRWYNTPDQLVERLGLLLASKQAGNTGVGNELSNIIDTLESSGYITRDQAIRLQSQV
jgi:hypothetical protein